MVVIQSGDLIKKSSTGRAPLLHCLINVSEKAANIARVCRQDQLLFQLLVEEKKNDEKNCRFLHDFKTLADVLIQEMVRHDLGESYPEIAAHIKGEESNSFSNTIGETITVKMMSTVDETSELLTQVLNGNSEAAQRLAVEVHRSMTIDQVNIGVDQLPTDLKSMPIEQFGIWIDPIDSTGEYISGDEVASIHDRVYMRGLACVTVLIGVFDRINGVPLMGVVNQPFHTLTKSEWRGKCEWGLCYEDVALSSVMNTLPDPRRAPLIVLSSSEDLQLKAKLTSAGYELVEVAGAGYKLLCVAVGLVDVYLLSKATTYHWDTCSPHAVLRAVGGDVITYKRGVSITYNGAEEDSGWCNTDGIIAARNKHLAKQVFTLISENN